MGGSVKSYDMLLLLELLQIPLSGVTEMTEHSISSSSHKRLGGEQ